MSTLNFPKNDKRSNGESFVKDRPWIKQGAYCSIVIPKRRMNYNCSVVHFDDAPSRVPDMVSSSYINK